MIYTHEAYAGPYSMVFHLPEELQNLTTKRYLRSLIFELHWWVIKLLAITKRPTSYWLKQDGNLYLCHVVDTGGRIMVAPQPSGIQDSVTLCYAILNMCFHTVAQNGWSNSCHRVYIPAMRKAAWWKARAHHLLWGYDSEFTHISLSCIFH